MKKLLPILIIAALFTACSKGNVSQANTNLLIGRWYAVKDTTTSFVNNVEANQTTFSYHTDANFVQFDTQGNGVEYVSETSPAYSETFTYTESGNKITFNYPAQVINGSQLSASTRVGTIKQLDVNNLVLTFNTAQTINGQRDSTAEVQYFSIN
jgi:hypothetical protein